MVQLDSRLQADNSGSINDRIRAIIQRQRDWFGTGQTKPVEFRLEQLHKLRQAIGKYQPALLEALKADLNKPPFEAFAFEVSATQELTYAIKHLRSWVKPQKVPVSIEQRPAKAQIYPEPLGVVLIISPWNYPFGLVLSPLVGAIAAGNCAVIKPSELAPQTSRVMAELIQDTFDPAYITVVEGGVEVSQALLEEKFDHIFFTGGTAIGKIVMAAAAKHLTPVTLELGGKSPCIVDREIHLEHAARRIAWGKFVNAGQTCVAPDYLLVDRTIKPALVEAIKAKIQEFYGDDPAQSPDFGRIINPKQFARLAELLHSGNIVTGGQTDPKSLYIAPTLLEGVSPEDPVMQEEIFGPILPILEYDDLNEAISLINAKPKPLALYIFSKNRQIQERILQATSSGGVCINDTIMQVGVSTLPFGGVGESGIGSYHGKASFDTFSHYKSVLVKPFWLDLKWRYAPYEGKLDFLKRILKL